MSLLDSPLPVEDRPARAWSDYQQAIFAAVRDAPQNNLLIQAVAGSGKTTTIVEALNHARGSSLFLAFNRSIAEELRSRVALGDVKTLNALGHGLWMRERRGARLEARKTSAILAGMLKPNERRELSGPIGRAIGLAKNNAFGLSGGPEPSPQAFEDIFLSYDLDIPEDSLAKASEAASAAFEMSRRDLTQFDFDDQLFIPLQEGWSYPRYTNVFVDEAQDLSPIQHLMLARMAEAGSRLVAVGDRSQAIYGFRGALANSMDRFRERFSAHELPLSISYRCPQAVVREAQRFCPHIQWADSAPEGRVLRADLEDEGSPREPMYFEPEAMVLCRNNAPLFRAILRHLRGRRPCRVRSNFLDGFAGFITGLNAGSQADLIAKLDAWYEREHAKALSAGFEGRLAFLSDKHATATLLANEFPTVDELILALRRIAEGTSGPILSTIHKAKGLEAKHVWLLAPDLLPSKWAKSPEARQQEANLQYVAITRAQASFTYGEPILRRRAEPEDGE